jgi:hypothetical protein
LAFTRKSLIKNAMSATSTYTLTGLAPYTQGANAGVDRADFANLRGVLCFVVHFSDATGHFTLWDGAQAVHGDYFDRAFRVSIWMSE